MVRTASCKAAAQQARTDLSSSDYHLQNKPPVKRPQVKLVESRDISFPAEDGFPLTGTLISNPGNTGPVVLINGATAVHRGYYMKFAIATVQAGARAALVYDYRGVASSQAPRDWSRRLNMKDWGTLDMPGAVRFLAQTFPGQELVGIGHSIGGTVLGLSGLPERFRRFAMIGSALGTLSMTDEPRKLYAVMNLIARPVALISRKVPGWLGIGETLPSSIFLDWARWCAQPNYLFDDADLAEKSRFGDVQTDILSVSVADDRWATPRAVLAHEARFPNARLTRLRLDPSITGAEQIGHFGLFRSRFSRDLWPKVIDWVLGTPESGPRIQMV